MEGLCQVLDEDDKDTIRVEIDLGDSGLEYIPGDALGIYPTNDPQASWSPKDFIGDGVPHLNLRKCTHICALSIDSCFEANLLESPSYPYYVASTYIPRGHNPAAINGGFTRFIYSAIARLEASPEPSTSSEHGQHVSLEYKHDFH